MTLPFDWDRYYREWEPGREPFPYYPEILARLAAPTEADVRWLLEGLKDGRTWFIASSFYNAAEVQWLLARPLTEHQRRVMAHCPRGPAFPEVFFKPLMDAGIDECEPSGCKRYVVPCSTVFGAPRALEYLYDVIEKEGTRRKVGALLALYMARCGWPVPPHDKVDEERWESLRERVQELALGAFLSSEDRALRFAALRELSMNVDHYPERLHTLARQFIQAALQSRDRKLRALVQHKLDDRPRVFPDTWPAGL